MKVELVPVTSANCIPCLHTKKSDLVICPLGKNPDREKVIDFTSAKRWNIMPKGWRSVRIARIAALVP